MSRFESLRCLLEFLQCATEGGRWKGDLQVYSKHAGPQDDDPRTEYLALDSIVSELEEALETAEAVFGVVELADKLLGEFLRFDPLANAKRVACDRCGNDISHVGGMQRTTTGTVEWLCFVCAHSEKGTSP